jgi:hypothetical protein
LLILASRGKQTADFLLYAHVVASNASCRSIYAFSSCILSRGGL